MPPDAFLGEYVAEFRLAASCIRLLVGAWRFLRGGSGFEGSQAEKQKGPPQLEAGP